MRKWSRNRTFGERIGKGETVDEIFSTQKAAVEGYKISKAFYSICGKKHKCSDNIGNSFCLILRHFSTKVRRRPD
jgi:glycerol-3-phosphate dehydrogenase